MADEYGRKAKDYTLRFEVRETQYGEDGTFIGVYQVGSSYSPYGALVDTQGRVYAREDKSAAPLEAYDAIVKARALVYRLVQKRLSPARTT